MRHLYMDAFCDKKTSKNSHKFYCKICNFECIKKVDYERHINTRKHSNLTLSNGQCDKKNIYTCCNCDKKYNSRNGLWNHKKICKKISENIFTETSDEISSENNISNRQPDITNDLIVELIKDNKEMKKLISVLIQNGINNTNNINNTTTNTNSHNKAFNLNFFLNETCKNAMNISEFVDSIKLQLSDLMNVGELGYVEGISKIIINKLNSLDETIRPLHCTDKKRETIYIKDEGQWEKDDENKSKLRKCIKKISDKNMKLLQVFREKYPDCREHDSILSNKYSKMVIEAMGGMGYTTSEQEEKIIRNISKVTTINKSA